jgi:hypothetical protein
MLFLYKNLENIKELALSSKNMVNPTMSIEDIEENLLSVEKNSKIFASDIYKKHSCLKEIIDEIIIIFNDTKRDLKKVLTTVITKSLTKVLTNALANIRYEEFLNLMGLNRNEMNEGQANITIKKSTLKEMGILQNWIKN